MFFSCLFFRALILINRLILWIHYWCCHFKLAEMIKKTPFSDEIRWTLIWYFVFESVKFEFKVKRKKPTVKPKSVRCHVYFYVTQLTYLTLQILPHILLYFLAWNMNSFSILWHISQYINFRINTACGKVFIQYIYYNYVE